ncbi:hypothetical protein CN151_23200 [Sinorhizobium meliloti]|uniref:hypothetical protein n=1 Tax=Rhizobium meliloti TaxID=382 RepID=UPI0009BBC115|nr:hypothetical protein [Sinorhizobium meliloti]RVK99131.1 hypothetical protein CN151_23200 [Sinorhizobium meliloti]RVM89565.1 hypothetical protein CN119_25310 [Sinorhizobium meliloti]RVN00415.1 hypothetical protein CN112_33245 [Sinorhizobium meliloti]
MAAYQKHQKSATSPTISGSFQYFKKDGNPLIEGVERFFSADQVSGNSFLAMKVTFINEMADLCEKVGAEVQKVAKAWPR